MDSFRSYLFREAYKKIHKLGDKLARIEPLIDWETFKPIAQGLYDNKGPKGGRPHIDPGVMVKLLVLQQWYGLSDPKLGTTKTWILVGPMKPARCFAISLSMTTFSWSGLGSSIAMNASAEPSEAHVSISPALWRNTLLVSKLTRLRLPFLSGSTRHSSPFLSLGE